MKNPTPLRQALSLLLLSLSLGLALPALAKEKKQVPALQCEQDGALKPCPSDSNNLAEKASKPKAFKAQADNGTDSQTQKKKKKKAKKKAKSTQSAVE
jgi:Na+-translocating ferredoxin:NAD+ oxidoreductase RNF subunit RnfB